MIVFAQQLPLLLAALLLTATGCRRQDAPPAKSTPPVVVDKVAHEGELNTIKLSPSAEKRLGITLAKIERRKIPRYRIYGGELTLPTGAALVVSAPVGGTLQAPSSKPIRVGDQVTARQPVYVLTPLLSPERDVLTPSERIRFAEAKNAVAQSQIDADGQVQQAQAQVDAAQIALTRAERLLREQAGTARAVDDAKAQLILATKALEAARSRKSLVDNIKLDEEPGKPVPIVIESPRRGIIRTEHVAVGEVVTAGAPLFEVMDAGVMWVRVAVYAGEVREIAGDERALISDLASREGEHSVEGVPIAAPPTAVPLAASVDLYYELANSDARWKPGERATVRLRERNEEFSLVVPWSAVVQDIHGGEWIYESVAPQEYARRRIQVLHVVEGQAVLSQGPPVGTQVVTAGVVELFGSEFGFAK